MRLFRFFTMSVEPEDMPFKVELWDRENVRVERVLARAANVLVARGAYDRAVPLYPGRVVTLRIGIRVVASTEE